MTGRPGTPLVPGKLGKAIAEGLAGACPAFWPRGGGTWIKRRQAGGKGPTQSPWGGGRVPQAPEGSGVPPLFPGRRDAARLPSPSSCMGTGEDGPLIWFQFPGVDSRGTEKAADNCGVPIRLEPVWGQRPERFAALPLFIGGYRPLAVLVQAAWGAGLPEWQWTILPASWGFREAPGKGIRDTVKHRRVFPSHWLPQGASANQARSPIQNRQQRDQKAKESRLPI